MEVSDQPRAPAALSPGERAPDIHWIGGWVGLRAVLHAVVKRKIPSPRRESKPGTPLVQPVAQRYTTDTTKEKFLTTGVPISVLKLVSEL
jgi:hypothetical protein